MRGWMLGSLSQVFFHLVSFSQKSFTLFFLFTCSCFHESYLCVSSTVCSSLLGWGEWHFDSSRDWFSNILIKNIKRKRSKRNTRHQWKPKIDLILPQRSISDYWCRGILWVPASGILLLSFSRNISRCAADPARRNTCLLRAIFGAISNICVSSNNCLSGSICIQPLVMSVCKATYNYFHFTRYGNW